MAKWLDKYEQGGMVLKKKTKDNYGKQSNYNDAKASVGPDFVGLGYNTKGRDYSPAWGGQFENGGYIAQKGVAVPTTADSARLFNSQMALNNFDAKEVKAESTYSTEEEGIDEIDLEELLRELDEMEVEENINLTSFPDEPGEHGNVAGKNVPDLNEAEEEEEEEEMKYDDEDADGIEDSDDDEIDIANMDESDLKSFIEGVIADMVAAGELEGGEGMEGEEGMESEEEVEINERKKYGGNKGDVPASKRGDKKDTAEEEGVEDYKKKLKEMKDELDEAYNALSTIKSELQEVNLFNANELNKVLNGSVYQKKWYLINLSQWHASRRVQ